MKYKLYESYFCDCDICTPGLTLIGEFESPEGAQQCAASLSPRDLEWFWDGAGQWHCDSGYHAQEWLINEVEVMADA